LVIAAIVCWNSAYLADGIDHPSSRSHAATVELLPSTSPLTWEHIRFSGDFLWGRAAATACQRPPVNLSHDSLAVSTSAELWFSRTSGAGIDVTNWCGAPEHEAGETPRGRTSFASTF